jgi:hypothetical protein
MHVKLTDDLFILTRFYLLIAMIRGVQGYISFELEEHFAFLRPNGLVHLSYTGQSTWRTHIESIVFLRKQEEPNSTLALICW